MKFGVVVFPGSNCDHDAFYAVGNVLQKPVEFIWHQSEDLASSDAIILPGGFAYGDYLRTGAIARFSPVMKSVEKFAKSGGMVFGICNGFQILLEAGLLPGAMMRNSGLRYICRHVHIRVEQTDTRVYQRGQARTRFCGFRLRTTTATTTRTKRRLPSLRKIAKLFSAIPRRTDQTMLPGIRMDPSPTLLAFATANAMWPGSCRIRSVPSNWRWIPRTGWSFFTP